MQSGLVLFPGGMMVLMLMPIVGWVLNRVESRWLVAFGFAFAAVGMTQLSHLNLNVSQSTPIFDWIVSRAWMAFLWVPMNVMAFYYVPRDKTNSATGLINLARNIGGSIGISFVTTMLSRRAQFHQNRFVEHLQPGSLTYQRAIHHIVERFSLHGFDAFQATQQAHRLLYQQVQKQAMMLSFVDNFRVMSLLCVSVIPLMFIMKKARARKGERVSAH
jgi:DHA2 family multidrug resistance protein